MGNSERPLVFKGLSVFKPNLGRDFGVTSVTSRETPRTVAALVQQASWPPALVATEPTATSSSAVSQPSVAQAPTAASFREDLSSLPAALILSVDSNFLSSLAPVASPFQL